MNHPRRDLRAVLCSSLLVATGCVLVCCRVGDSGNPAYRRDDCKTGSYRGFCETPDASGSEAGRADAALDADTDQPSNPSTAGEPCAHATDEKLCYDGPDRTKAQGACISGVAKCVGGRWTECFGQVLPAAETCNGRDDDCDRRVDEDAHGDCVVPDTGCPGRLECQRGRSLCTAIADPMPETCNALDDDCDGEVDEDSDRACIDDNAGCNTNSAGDIECRGACAPGVQRCHAGALEACLGQQQPKETERCDEGEAGVDDDCDGRIDEACPCRGTRTRACYAASAAQAGACLPGSQQCVKGSWGPCTNASSPHAEACPDDEVDNDCNGQVDDVQGRGESCSSSRPGRCHNGKQQCVGDQLRCVTPGAKDEICNAVDDDCDGDTDETFDLLNDRKHCGDCDTECGQGKTCCNGKCADTRTDEDHCGVCDVACGSGFSCCDAFCAPVKADPGNCGACGHACPDQQGCCDGSCVDLQGDAQHCGDCSRSCEESCVDGDCFPM